MPSDRFHNNLITAKATGLIVLCLIYIHEPEGRRPKGKYVYIRQSTHAHGITITYILQYIHVYIQYIATDNITV